MRVRSIGHIPTSRKVDAKLTGVNASPAALFMQSMRSGTTNRRPASQQSFARSQMQRCAAGWNRANSVGMSRAWMRWLSFYGSAKTVTLVLSRSVRPGEKR